MIQFAIDLLKEFCDDVDIGKSMFNEDFINKIILILRKTNEEDDLFVEKILDVVVNISNTYPSFKTLITSNEEFSNPFILINYISKNTIILPKR
jgi:hypothetical protein